MKSAKESGKSDRRRTAKNTSRAAHAALPLAVLMKFRLIVNSAKHHFKWVERQCGINGAQLWVLWEVNRAPGLRVSDLIASMAMHQSTVSNLLDKLARAALITRKRESDDQRVVTLFLTGSGKALLKKAPQPARGRLPEALFRLSRKSLTSLDQLLDEVLKQMGPAEQESMKRPLAEMLAGR